MYFQDCKMHLNFDYPGTHTGQPFRIELSIHTILDQKGY